MWVSTKTTHRKSHKNMQELSQSDVERNSTFCAVSCQKAAKEEVTFFITPAAGMDSQLGVKWAGNEPEKQARAAWESG